MDIQNPCVSGFDGEDVDGHLFWFYNICIINSWIMFNKKGDCYVKNVKQYSEFLMLNRSLEVFLIYVTSD